MRRRHKTQITVWPAITDLMTAIVVITILGGVIGCHKFKDIGNHNGILRDSIELQKSEINNLRDSLNTINNSNSQLQYSIKILQDSLSTRLDTTNSNGGEGIDKPSCLGLRQNKQPNVLMTIQVYPDNKYSIEGITNDIDLSNRWPEIATYFNNTLTQNIKISSNEMINHARQIYNLSQEKKCVSYVILQNGGVSRESLIVKWTDLEIYDLRLANPRILRRSP